MTDYAALLPEDRQALEQMAVMLRANPGLLAELESLEPTVKSKHALIDRMVPAPLRPVCKALSDNDDFALLPELLGKALGEPPVYPKGPVAEILYAAPPTDEQRRGLKRFVEAQSGEAHTRIAYREDRSLLGGFIVRVNGRELDYSLRGRLNALRQNVMEPSASFDSPGQLISILKEEIQQGV